MTEETKKSKDGLYLVKVIESLKTIPGIILRKGEKGYDGALFGGFCSSFISEESDVKKHIVPIIRAKERLSERIYQSLQEGESLDYLFREKGDTRKLIPVAFTSGVSGDATYVQYLYEDHADLEEEK